MGRSCATPSDSLNQLGRGEWQQREQALGRAGLPGSGSTDCLVALVVRTLRVLNGGTVIQPKDSTGGLCRSPLRSRLADRVDKLWLDGRAKAPAVPADTDAHALTALAGQHGHGGSRHRRRADGV
ncbi:MULTISPECIES: hypothetical protein [unclassified Streptomyces]|uniref:hypothetical protein n=1 Tax=unclassified Streptomyces TaxID=2593676 RepID=UPI002366202E|nr:MULTISPECIES: hypothetical protein [unclassified Streptomyces]MDF3145151.1 hypothetical protein [Streptomyces sp. T21Q-yed]WDF42086.1 hypothetical protein PBV52_37435 [Streptomyces sp. T12]